MKKQITFLLFTLLFALTSSQVMAQKNVLYLILDGVKIYNDDAVAGIGYGINPADMTYGVSTKSSLFGDDPVLRMLNADPNFSVTYVTVKNGTAPASIVTGIHGAAFGNNVVNGNLDTTGFDLIIATETLQSAFTGLMGGATPGVLAPNQLTAPIIYAKPFAFVNGKTISSAAAAVTQTQNLSMEVVDAASPIFTGITVSNGSSIPLFRTTSDDYGVAAGQKALDIVNDVELTDATTLLATVPEITNQATAIGINYLPATTQIGTDATVGVLAQPAVILPFSWGATVKQDGGNITSELLTIWRNAAYMLTGQTASIPAGMVANPAASNYEIASTTYTYDFRNGTFINTTTPGTLLETLTPDMAVDGINNLNDVKTAPTFTQYKSDIELPFSPNIAQARVDYIAGSGDNFYDATNGINLKAGSKLQIKPYGTGVITIPLLAASDLDYAMSVANINSNAWIVVNGVSQNGPAKISVAETFEGTGAGEIVIDVYATIGKSTNFTFTADATAGGTDMYIPYVNVTYSYLQFIPQEVAYVQKSGFTSGTGASASTNDPIFRMLDADPNFVVTVIETDAAGTGLDLTGYDLVIAQETFGSGDGIWSGPFDVQTNTVPIIFNKTWAWQKSKNHIASAAAAVALSAEKSISIDPSNQDNTLFNGIDFTGGNEIILYNELATNNGANDVTGTNAIDILQNIEIGVLGTNLATVSDVTTSPDTSIVINEIPQGTQIGTNSADVLQAPMIAFSFNYGAIIKNDGANISPEALTIWRNAAYKLIGLTVPSTLVANPDFTLGIDKVGEVSAVTSNVRAIGNRIYVSNVKSATEVNIYSITGALVKTIKTNEDTDFNFKTGIWIATVKTFEGAKAVKLLTR